MPQKTSILTQLMKRRWVLYVAVFVAFLIIHIFIFRDVVASIPAVWRGDEAIVREELVPFFNFDTQFWGTDAANLTSSDEIRTGYSFWTAWVRYAPVLPVALVLLNALSAFLLFYAFHLVGRYFSKERPYFGIAAAFLAALVIHGILLYAKVAHFYVLIIGFSLFALAMSLVIEQVFFRRKLRWRNVAAVSLAVLANPAVHFHIIFYLLMTVILLVYSVFVWVVNRPYFWLYLKKHLIYLVAVVCLSLLPYGLLIWLMISGSVGSVSTDIPVNYWLIYYSSLSLPFMFTFDTAGHLDWLRYGGYLAPLPRIGSVIITFLIASVFLFRQWANVTLARQVLIVTLFVTMLAAMWMSVGYSQSDIFSFHMLLSGLAGFLADQSNAVAEGLSKGLGVFINVLRFPHRFQFIYFYVGGLLLMIALVWLYDLWRRRFGKRILAASLVSLLVLMPFLASGDYRTALTSGNLGTFVRPYPIPDDLKEIKDILATRQDDKLFVLPSMESGRVIMSDGNGYGFLDKFFIYYLDQPTLYYGVGASTQNKIIAYLAYRAIVLNEAWWEDILVNYFGVTHVLMPKQMHDRNVGLVYMPGIFANVPQALAKSTKFRTVYDGQHFALYEARQARAQDAPMLIDLQWESFLRFMHDNDLGWQHITFPLVLEDFIARPKGELVSDSPERSFYTLYGATTPDSTFYPSQNLLPFYKEQLASSNFTNNALSLDTLYTVDDDYNHLRTIVPSLAGLRVPKFIGLTKGNGHLDVPFNVPSDGTYRLLVHGGAQANGIIAHLGGQSIELKKVAQDQKGQNHIDITYFYADVPLVAGDHRLEIQNLAEHALVVESLTLMPAKDVPHDFAHGRAAHFIMQPAQAPGTFTVTMQGDQQ